MRHVIPAKAGTYPHDRHSRVGGNLVSVASHRHRRRLKAGEAAVEGGLPQVLGRGRPARVFWIPAYAGMTVIVGVAPLQSVGVAPPVPSPAAFAASSPILGRGGLALARPKGGEIPAYAGMTVMGVGMTMMGQRE